MVTSKLCSVCKEDKPVSQFGSSGKGDGKPRAYCKVCAAVYRARPEVKTRQQTYTSNPEYLARRRSVYDPLQERARKLWSTYRLTVEEYETILSNQDNKCAICLREFLDVPKSKHVDHCHDSGKVRGVLCGSCNTGLGNFREDFDTFERAVEYLRRFRN